MTIQMTQPPARVRWQQLVDAKVKAGLTETEAIRAVNRENPQLYYAQLALKAEQTETPAPAPTVPSALEQLYAEYEKRGMSRFDAIRAAHRAAPHLYRLA